MKSYNFKLAFLVIVLLSISCKQQAKKEGPTSCIDRIIKTDDSLGTIRNHACETISLSKTITNYADALNNLDFNNCPEGFSTAFKDHETAWRKMIIITDKHSELRGEMHDLFDQIEVSNDSTQFKKALKEIWDTWPPIKEIMGN